MSDDVTDSFRSSLDDLKINSKPQISMLTMLAEDHEQYAVDIVRVIEEQIKKVHICLLFCSCAFKKIFRFVNEHDVLVWYLELNISFTCCFNS